MSRIGKQPIPLPDGVKVEIKRRQGHGQRTQGRLGTALCSLGDVGDRRSERGGQAHRRLPAGPRLSMGCSGPWSTTWWSESRPAFPSSWNWSGWATRPSCQGQALNLAVGYSHPVNFPLPQGIEADHRPPEDYPYRDRQGGRGTDRGHHPGPEAAGTLQG